MPDPWRMTLEFTGLPGMNTQHTRRHWAVAKKEADAWRTLIRRRVRLEARRLGIPKAPLLRRARVTFIRLSSVRPDRINHAQSCKPILDALTRSRYVTRTVHGRRVKVKIHRADVLWDDDPETLDDHYRWEYAPPRKGGIRIEVEEIA